MKSEKIQELIHRYNTMQADSQEMKEIENLIESGKIDLTDLEDMYGLEQRLSAFETPPPSLRLDDNFYAMLKGEKGSVKSSGWKNFFAWPDFAPRLALASFTMIIGIAVGFFLRSPVQKDEQIEMLGQQVSGLKELMMLSLLEKESATDRLKAVSLTQEMDQASQKVTSALLQTLNSDENVNVRLAALDALKPYSRESKVREELIRSISKQDSPLVQISLAELMAELQAKSSVKELEKILHNENTPVDVKKKIEESIKVLI
ncbi:MAG: anti-sigma factor [Marivirga sp.]|nr:anti-sigma factor [Marivirga sp.]